MKEPLSPDTFVSESPAKAAEPLHVPVLEHTSRGAEIEAEAGKGLYENIHKNVVDYLHKAEHRNMLIVPAENSLLFYNTLRGKIVGTPEEWDHIIQYASGLGAEGGKKASGLLHNHKQKLKATIRHFIEAQAEAGVIHIAKDMQNAFFSGLSEASVFLPNGMNKY